MELVKITYRFADGHVEELEVEPEVAETIKELDRQEYNNNQKESRRHVTFDASEELAWLAVEDQRLARLLSGVTDEQMLYDAIGELNPKQQELIFSVFFKNISISEIARRSGVSQPAISQRVQTAINKLKKLLPKTL
jgi:RNA polymerase sigma factor (sigma-70 family)